MSSSQSSKPRNRTNPRTSSPSENPMLMLIKQRINRNASNTKSPLKPSNSPITKEFIPKEARPKVSLKRKLSSACNIEEFLTSNGFERYVNYFTESQITLADLPYLTKEDFNDMKMPIGPRNRLMKLIENLNIKDEVKSNCELSRRENASNYEPSTMRSGLRDEVDKFMTELSQFSKRSEQKVRPSSRDQSLESFDSEIGSRGICENILGLLKDINEKQNIMMKAIGDSQKAISTLRVQYFNSRKNKCTCSDY
ncbi:hypothetical protein SteCoe_29556 [Stentor coeruleus]|uniref:SAM domain-containing protein n=1 Tax=Stentor coeruleus TaxID=5963 RepID=A0A1R2B5R0_9CILI|nr:hypothetical protein SteCoe_29556 [Stentor coeruleus]